MSLGPINVSRGKTSVKGTVGSQWGKILQAGLAGKSKPHAACLQLELRRPQTFGSKNRHCSPMMHHTSQGHPALSCQPDQMPVKRKRIFSLFIVNLFTRATPEPDPTV